MVNNNQIPIEVNKKPFETVCEINDEIPSYEEFMKGYEAGVKLNYDDLNGGEVGEVKGYGPCYRRCGYANRDCECYFGYLGKDYVALHLACPGEGCVGGSPYLWVHSDPCSGHMYINEDAHLRCMKCGENGYITEWRFKCWKHKGEGPSSFYPTNNTNCISAMSTVLQMFQNKPDAIKRVIGKIIREITRKEGY